LFFFSIVSFSFDDTNGDSIGDNKSYHSLLNACVRSKFFYSLTKKKYIFNKSIDNLRKSVKISKVFLVYVESNNIWTFLSFSIVTKSHICCFINTNYHLFIKFIHAKNDYHLIRQTKSPIS
jgi:hypothetical protein